MPYKLQFIIAIFSMIPLLNINNSLTISLNAALFSLDSESCSVVLVNIVFNLAGTVDLDLDIK